MKYKLKQIAEIINGSTPSTSNSEYWDGDISWITPKDMSLQMKRYISNGGRNITQKGYDSCSTTLVPKDTILLTSRAPIGYISIAQNELCTNQGFKSIICGDKVLPLFMYYWLSTKVDFLKSISNGATFKELSKQALENVEIDLPNLETQQHIVDTIGSVDDLIEKYEDLYLKIQEFLILKYTQLQSQEGLKVVDIFKCFNGGTFKSADYVETSNKKLVTIKNIDATGFNLQDITYLKDSLDCEKYALKYGDILLTMTGAYLGRCGIVSEKNCYQNQRILKVVGESKAFTYVFLKVNEKAIFSMGKGSAQPNLSLQDFYQMKVPYSALDIKQFKQYDDLFDIMLNIKLKQQKAKEQKQKLLQKYFG